LSAIVLVAIVAAVHANGRQPRLQEAPPQVDALPLGALRVNIPGGR
jgi:hypothetical protein